MKIDVSIVEYENICFDLLGVAYLLCCVGRVEEDELNNDINYGLETLGNVIRHNVEKLNELKNKP